MQPRERIAVVGRTGAGKSSLALSLLRSLEATEGKTLIDDIDISKIGLHDLRQAIVYVPQDPSLFAGDLRSNLDPFGQYTDEQIHDALREVGLIDDSNDAETVPDTASPTPANRDAFKDLGMVLSESGSGVSLGQRQLLCLARALLRNPKIFIMDEATASIDHATDKNIQLSISRIKGTVITIAHRLRTIIDYDNVLSRVL